MVKIGHSCEKEIQNVHLRVTPARLAAMQLFESHQEPLDVQHVSRHLQKNQGVDRVTVFRILNAFIGKGLIKKIMLGENKARYELNNKDHHHLVCQRCGAIEDFSDCNIQQLEQDIRKKKNFIVTQHALEFFGMCRNCQL